MTGLTLVSLFAGIGGFDLAAQRVGITPVAAVEIDKQATGVLRHHFPDVTLFDDVRTVTADDLRAAGFVPERGIVVNALTSATGGPDDNDAQAGHLVYVKAARSGAPYADGSLPPETWIEGGGLTDHEHLR